MSSESERVSALVADLRRAVHGAGGLPERDIESIEVLIRVGEWQIALEHLCTQIYEYDIAIDPTERRLLEELGFELGVAVSGLLE
jgi:hypothetical protein